MKFIFKMIIDRHYNPNKDEYENITQDYEVEFSNKEVIKEIANLIIKDYFSWVKHFDTREQLQGAIENFIYCENLITDFAEKYKSELNDIFEKRWLTQL